GGALLPQRRAAGPGGSPRSGRVRRWSTPNPGWLCRSGFRLEYFPALVEVERVKENRRGVQEPPCPAPLPPLERLGDYRIRRVIGRGGMGVVYEAEQLSLGRRVALKVLPRQIVQDPKTLARFRREARSAAQLHHTNIVPVFEVGRDGEVSSYTMQFIQG